MIQSHQTMTPGGHPRRSQHHAPIQPRAREMSQDAILCSEYKGEGSPTVTSQECAFNLRQRIQQSLGCHPYEERYRTKNCAS